MAWQNREKSQPGGQYELEASEYSSIDAVLVRVFALAAEEAGLESATLTRGCEMEAEDEADSGRAKFGRGILAFSGLD